MSHSGQASQFVAPRVEVGKKVQDGTFFHGSALADKKADGNRVNPSKLLQTWKVCGDMFR
jgi:hypothetical protein